MLSIREHMEYQGFQFQWKGQGEWETACPKCGGKSRFLVWDNTNRYYCRHCEVKGDVIAYLRDIEGKSFADAVRISGKYVQPRPVLRSTVTTRCWEPAPATSPTDKWSMRASEVVEAAMQALWRQPATLEYLHRRGLQEKTVFLAQLGWLEHPIYEERHLWGLEVAPGREKLYIPRGLLVPYWDNGKLVRLRVRVENPKDGNRYRLVAGSSLRPSLFGQGNSVIIMENDLDAMAIAQDAGDLVQSLGMLSCAFRPDKETHSLLLRSRILLALDDDAAGNKAATEFWCSQYPNSIRHLPLRGKDIGEMVAHGVQVRPWVQAGIDSLSQC